MRLNPVNITILVESWGKKCIFYNPQNLLKSGMYILTIKEKDGKNNKACNLNRENTFRVNLGLRKQTFNDQDIANIISVND
ncbi:DUF6194 family protein [Clostridium sp. YIM B02555]|uniref:DUF6194 family protein n=1 Tax=Clostridium sp. YIM B02555 TaxID=2911968 RepID=UPI001EEEB8DC|nr:DUF6194 family protein [Clostridium sp. YIM B02555]